MSIRKPSTMLPLVTVWLTPSAEASELVAAGRQGRIGDQFVVARLQLLGVDDGDRDARDADAAAVDIRRDRHAAGHRVVRRRRRPTRRRPRAAARPGRQAGRGRGRAPAASSRRRRSPRPSGRSGRAHRGCRGSARAGDRRSSRRRGSRRGRREWSRPPGSRSAPCSRRSGRRRSSAASLPSRGRASGRRRGRRRSCRRRRRRSSPGRSSTGRRSPGRAGRAGRSARGRCPGRAISPLRSAICVVSELTEATEVFRSCVTPVCSDRAGRRRCGTRRDLADAASATWRADESCGLLATSTNALKTARGGAHAVVAGREHVLELLQLLGARVVGRGHRAVVAACGSGSRCARASRSRRRRPCRRSRRRSAGRPTVASSTRLARVAGGVGVRDVVAGRLHRRVVREHGAHADAEQARRRSSVDAAQVVRCRRSVVLMTRAAWRRRPDRSRSRPSAGPWRRPLARSPAAPPGDDAGVARAVLHLLA